MSDIDPELRPRPWWVGTGERLFTSFLIILGGLPILFLTENVYAAAISGLIVAGFLNACYWRFYQNRSLREVYLDE